MAANWYLTASNTLDQHLLLRTPHTCSQIFGKPDQRQNITLATCLRASCWLNLPVTARSRQNQHFASTHQRGEITLPSAFLCTPALPANEVYVWRHSCHRKIPLRVKKRYCMYYLNVISTIPYEVPTAGGLFIYCDDTCLSNDRSSLLG
jgi:hypothetical protein